jgi:hypothetical protein
MESIDEGSLSTTKIQTNCGVIYEVWLFPAHWCYFNYATRNSKHLEEIDLQIFDMLIRCECNFYPATHNVHIQTTEKRCRQAGRTCSSSNICWYSRICTNSSHVVSEPPRGRLLARVFCTRSSPVFWFPEVHFVPCAHLWTSPDSRYAAFRVAMGPFLHIFSLLPFFWWKRWCKPTFQLRTRDDDLTAASVYARL